MPDCVPANVLLAQARDAMERLSGKAKQRGGTASGDRSAEAWGNRERTRSDVKHAGENVEDLRSRRPEHGRRRR